MLFEAEFVKISFAAAIMEGKKDEDYIFEHLVGNRSKGQEG